MVLSIIKRNSTINEILRDIDFGLTPIAAGYIAESNIFVIFVVIIIYGIGALIFLIYLSRNFKRNI